MLRLIAEGFPLPCLLIGGYMLRLIAEGFPLPCLLIGGYMLRLTVCDQSPPVPAMSSVNFILYIYYNRISRNPGFVGPARRCMKGILYQGDVIYFFESSKKSKKKGARIFFRNWLIKQYQKVHQI